MYGVPAVTDTGVANVTVCQPVLDSPTKVAVPRSVPVSVQIEPVWVPRFWGPL